VRVRAQTRQVLVLEQVKELEPVPLGRELDRQAWAQQEQAQELELRQKESEGWVAPLHQLVPGRVQEQARSERFRLRV
jgi:hypothetical protein